MRIENIGDTFDTKLAFKSVDLKRLTHQLFVLVNGDRIPFSVETEELSLSANQSLEEMKVNRLTWSTVDDSDVEETTNVDESSGMIVL